MAVLWSLHRTAEELGFDQIGSTLAAIRRMFFDFSVARSAFVSFAAKARDEERLGQTVTPEIEALVDVLARPDLPKLWQVVDWFWIATLAVVVPIAPYGLPILMSTRDNRNIARARRLFEMRRSELAAAAIDVETQKRVRHILDDQAKTFLTFEAINRLYYQMVLRNQAWYYGAVFVLFFMLVLVNYALIRLRVL